uniref:Uncharacterized protein n=1 Tax=Physcomitrium patens TaxID=3218 RepID=A0A2K1KJV0_PHYPA|nr:hypothetical protein PHYPA_007733 [Physcomitrium patens]
MFISNHTYEYVNSLEYRWLIEMIIKEQQLFESISTLYSAIFNIFSVVFKGCKFHFKTTRLELYVEQHLLFVFNLLPEKTNNNQEKYVHKSTHTKY